MELYDLRRGDMFKIATDNPYVPQGEEKPMVDNTIYKHEKIDGMYSRNIDPNGKVIYLAAWTPVELIEVVE
jgi:hypothetical protein